MSTDPQDLYVAASRAQSEGDWRKAIVLCGQLLALEPKHPGATALLVRARDALRQRRAAPPSEAETPRAAPPSAHRRNAAGAPSSASSPEVAAWYERGLSAWERGDWASARTAFQWVEARAPGYRDTASRLREVQAEIEQAHQRAEARLAEAQAQVELAAWHEQGMRARRRGDWAAARGAFRQVATRAPSYRDAIQRLAEAEQQVALATWYQRGVRAWERHDWAAASAALERVTRIALGYRDATALLVEAQVRLAEAQEQVDLAAWYEQGLRAWERGDWPAATAALERVTRIAPGYENAATLLTEARARLAETRSTRASRRAGAPSRTGASATPPAAVRGGLGGSRRRQGATLAGRLAGDKRQKRVPLEPYPAPESSRPWKLGVIGLVVLVALLLAFLSPQCRGIGSF